MAKNLRPTVIENMKKIKKVNRFEVIDWTPSGKGRDFSKWVSEKDKFNVYYDIQDEGRTIKIFLADKEIKHG